MPPHEHLELLPAVEYDELIYGRLTDLSELVRDVAALPLAETTRYMRGSEEFNDVSLGQGVRAIHITPPPEFASTPDRRLHPTWLICSELIEDMSILHEAIAEDRLLMQHENAPHDCTPANQQFDELLMFSELDADLFPLIRITGQYFGSHAGVVRQQRSVAYEKFGEPTTLAQGIAEHPDLNLTDQQMRLWSDTLAAERSRLTPGY